MTKGQTRVQATREPCMMDKERQTGAPSLERIQRPISAKTKAKAEAQDAFSLQQEAATGAQ